MRYRFNSVFFWLVSTSTQSFKHCLTICIPLVVRYWMVTWHRIVVGHASIEPDVKVLVPKSFEIICPVHWCNNTALLIFCCRFWLRWLIYSSRDWIWIWHAADECFIPSSVNESLVHVWLSELVRERFISHTFDIVEKFRAWTIISATSEQYLISFFFDKLFLLERNTALLKGLVAWTSINSAIILDFLSLLIQNSLITWLLIHPFHDRFLSWLLLLWLVLEWFLEHLFFLHLVHK